MNTGHLDIDRIKRLAGQQMFREGQLSFEQKMVHEFSLRSDHATGIIDGFQTKLTMHGERPEGECSCPASEGFEFCPHCVHLALHTIKLQQQMLSLSKGPDKSKVLAFLLSLDKQELAKHMLVLLEQNKEQFQRYLLKANLVSGEPDYAALKKDLTQLTRMQENLFSQRQVKHFFSRIERFLDEVSVANYQADPDAMLKLVEYAIARVNALLDKMEDRSGQRETTVAYLASMFQELFAYQEGRDETLCKRFEKTWLIDRHLVLGLHPDEYLSHRSELLGLLNARWLERWKILCKDQSNARANAWLKKKLARYFIELIAKDSSFDLPFDEVQGMRIELAVSDQDYLQVARFWVHKGLAGKAIALLEAQVAQGASEQNLLHELVHLYSADTVHANLLEKLLMILQGFPKEAGAQVFERAEALALGRNFYEQALVILKAQQVPELAALLIKSLLKLDRQQEALEWARDNALENSLISELVLQLKDNYPAMCVELLQSQISRLLGKKMVSADRKAAALLVLLESLQEHVAFDRFIVSIQPKVRSRPKFVESYEQIKTNALP